MKRSIAVKALSAGLCVAFGMSLAACEGKVETTKDTEAESTMDSKPVATSESETETTVETTESETSETSETTVESTTEMTLPEVNPYEEFIAGYQEAIKLKNGTWYYGPGVDTSDYMNLGQGLIVNEMGDSFGYTLYDFDKDGVYELVIGGVFTRGAGDSEKGVYIRGIVTLDGDEYKIVAAGWTRSNLDYAGNGYFVHSGSGGAALHYDAVYTYDGVNKKLATVGMLVTEYVDNDGQVTPNYSYFADDDDAFHAFPAYGNENADCFDDEAKKKFDKDYEIATSQTNELLNITWVRVDCV